MGNTWSLESFFTPPSVEIRLVDVLLNLGIAALLAFVLGRIYVRYGTSLSNRRLFAGNFLLLACTTTLVITIVKSSLALSLGLVGALSIVRFRSAIKEPEELTYLFLAIAIGLGLGADQTLLTIVAYVFIVGLLILRSVRKKPASFQNLYLTIATKNPSRPSLDEVVAVVEPGCTSLDLRRFDERPDGLEASFLVGFEGFQQVERVRQDLRKLSESIEISFIDNRGII